MMIVVVSLAVALVAFIVYALERRSKDEPIVWADALKLSLFGGLVSAGVVFTTTAETVTAVTTAVAELPAAAQEMFVGNPTF
jgi:TRAP-type C4-dicarboxylate transport system permease small subunit